VRAFLIPHASPHNSHANRISCPRREVERAKQKEQRDYYRHGRPTFAHNATRASVLLDGCFASCGRKFATIKYSTRTRPRAIISRSASVPRREYLRAIARKISRRAVVIACSRFPAQISTRDCIRGYLFSFIRCRNFFAFFISRVMNQLVSRYA